MIIAKGASIFGCDEFRVFRCILPTDGYDVTYVIFTQQQQHALQCEQHVSNMNNKTCNTNSPTNNINRQHIIDYNINNSNNNNKHRNT